MPRSEPVEKLRVVVVMPTYNERGNLAELVETVIGHGYEALVVDDDSPDGTGAEADRLAAQTPGLSVCHRHERQGLGPAYAEGFDLAIKAGYDIICGMDADLSHDPAVLPDLVAPVAEAQADMVIGSRYVAGGGIPDWSIFRRALSHWGNIYARWALGIEVKDATSGLRAYRANALERLEVASCRSVGYLFLTEVSWRATVLGLDITEIPITFRRRLRGESKMGGRIIFEAMALVTFWGLRRRLFGQSVKPEAISDPDLDRAGGSDT